jgi:hypothetical protein
MTKEKKVERTGGKAGCTTCVDPRYIADRKNANAKDERGDLV